MDFYLFFVVREDTVCPLILEFSFLVGKFYFRFCPSANIGLLPFSSKFIFFACFVKVDLSPLNISFCQLTLELCQGRAQERTCRRKVFCFGFHCIAGQASPSCVASPWSIAASSPSVSHRQEQPTACLSNPHYPQVLKQSVWWDSPSKQLSLADFDQIPESSFLANSTSVALERLSEVWTNPLQQGQELSPMVRAGVRALCLEA